LLARAATPRAGLIGVALFAAAPITLYFGGFPDVIGMPLVLFVLLTVMGYLHFHHAPGDRTFLFFVAAFVLAGVCDWPAYLVVPVFVAHFIATRPRRQWPWIVAFAIAACMLFAALYVYIMLATGSPWDWMIPLFTRRSALVGGRPFALRQWLAAVFAFNRTYHTLLLLVTAGLWVIVVGFRRHHASPGVTVARLLLAWGVLYVVVGSKAV